MNIKFQQYYVTNGIDKVSVSYSLDNRIDGKKCITIYSNDYGEGFYRIFGDLSKNDSDLMTDYFETSHADIFEDHQLYKLNREKVETYIKKIKERYNKARGIKS